MDYSIRRQRAQKNKKTLTECKPLAVAKADQDIARVSDYSILGCHIVVFLHEYRSIIAGFLRAVIFLSFVILEIYFNLRIFTARAYARAVLGVVILSVCPSVCHTRGL